LERDKSGASIAYGWAGRAARDGGEPALAIEGFRMAGQIAGEDGNDDVAGKLFAEAYAIAKGLPADAAGRTSAPLAARQLAEYYAEHGMGPQAAAMSAQADKMDAAARGESA